MDNLAKLKCDLAYRDATIADHSAMLELIHQHGPNQWNYLPEEGVRDEIAEVGTAKASAVLAISDGKIVGFAVFSIRIRFPQYANSNASEGYYGYIGDVVVHTDFQGQGMGSVLLTEATTRLNKLNVKEVFIDCHEENLASRGMMRKAGFTEVATFYDPERRFVGSRKTCVCKWMAELPG